MNEKQRASKTIGIVIPSYNQGKYLEKTIKSVLANAVNASIKIALVDGGSSDNSLDIISRYRDQLDICISEPDKGQADAINKGIRSLPGCDFYTWINSDDEYEDDLAIKRIVDFATEGNYDVCYGRSHYIDVDSNNIGEYPVEKYDKKRLGQTCYLSQPSVIFSAVAYEKVGMLNERLQMCLDYEYWIRLSKEYDFAMIDQFVGSTRMYDETKTATQKRRHLAEGMYVLNKYYGKVPMVWVTTEYLNEHPDSPLRNFHYVIISGLLFFRRQEIINSCISRLEFDD